MDSSPELLVQKDLQHQTQSMSLKTLQGNGWGGGGGAFLSS